MQRVQREALQQAIDACLAQQTFLDIESGRYVSHLVEVELVALLRAALEARGCARDGP